MTISNDFVSEPISEKDIKNFFSIIGREVGYSLLHPPTVKLILQFDKRDKKIAMRYNAKVWKKRDVGQYLLGEATKCAEHAALFFSGDRNFLTQTFFLTNPHGKNFPGLGLVHFRRPNNISEFLNKSVSDFSSENCFAIERIELHPSLQKRGFLNLLAEEFRLKGGKLMILQNVINPSFAFHLYQASLTIGSKIILISEPNTVDFENSIDPGPTFGWRLN